MQAIELDAMVDSQHQLHVHLPASVPQGKARLILLFEAPLPQKEERQFGLFRGQGQVPPDFNDALPETFWTDSSP